MALKLAPLSNFGNRKIGLQNINRMDGFNGIVIFLAGNEDQMMKDRLIDGIKRRDPGVDSGEH